MMTNGVKGETTVNKMIETICERQSIRRFLDKSVDKKDIRDILRAAMNAPSACSQQIWQFVVIDDKRILKALSAMHSGISFLAQTPLAVVVCGEPQAAVLDYFWEDDCAAATQNILLAAHALGLGATWSGINRKASDMVEFVQSTVKIPKAHIPFSIIAIGYPDEQRRVRDRFAPAKIHHNAWDLQWNE